jgi:hypothetical protein
MIATLQRLLHQRNKVIDCTVTNAVVMRQSLVVASLCTSVAAVANCRQQT